MILGNKPRYFVHAAVFWLNAFPHPEGVSQTLSPRAIVTGETLDYNRHVKFEFGEYVQTHEKHDNSMTTRTIGALALRPTGNAQGSYTFFSLNSGRVITRGRATKIPMPDEVISRVHNLARQQKADRGLVFGDRNNRSTIDDATYDSDDDDDDDETYYDEDDVEADDDYDDGWIEVSSTSDTVPFSNRQQVQDVAERVAANNYYYLK